MPESVEDKTGPPSGEGTGTEMVKGPDWWEREGDQFYYSLRKTRPRRVLKTSKAIGLEPRPQHLGAYGQATYRYVVGTGLHCMESSVSFLRNRCTALWLGR